MEHKTEPLKPMAVEGLLRLFDILDTDGNGSISQAELYRELRLFGFTKDQIEVSYFLQ